MANMGFGIAGFGQGIVQGFNMQRQAALEQAYLKIAQEREARLGQLMEAQEAARQEKHTADMSRLERAEFTEPLDTLLHANPELGYQLAPGYKAAKEFQSAPLEQGQEENSPMAKGDFYRLRDQSIREAAARATGIRKEREQHDLDKQAASQEAIIARALGQKQAQTREQLLRGLGGKVLNRDIELPEGVTLENVVDNLLAGDASTLPSKTPKIKEAEAISSFNVIEQELENIGEQKKSVNTGVGSEIFYAIPRLLGMEPEKRKALRSNLVAIISQWVKQQTGVQYGFRELRWLSDAAPKMTDDDKQFEVSLREFKRRAQIVKQARLAALKAGRYGVDQLDIPELGSEPDSPGQPAGPVIPTEAPIQDPAATDPTLIENLGVHPVPRPGMRGPPPAPPAPVPSHQQELPPLRTLRWID